MQLHSCIFEYIMRALQQIRSFKKATILLFCVWSLLMAGLALYGVNLHHLNIEGLARHLAIDLLHQDLDYRAWNARSGGVYVKVSAKNPPNPYLDHLPNRDVTTTTGQQLTLVNPAYMSRMVYEISQTSGGHVGHITSLTPLRPDNRPDRWEKQALLQFAAGKVEITEISLIEGKPYLRYMRRLTVKQKCLKCHTHQGYKVGDICGGLSMNILLQPLQDSLAPQLRHQLIIYLILYVLGSVVIYLAFNYFEKDLLKINEQSQWISALFNSSFIGIGQVSNRVVINANHRFCEIFGYSRDELIGKNTEFLYPSYDEYEKVAELYQEEQSLEIPIKRKDGTIIDLQLASSHLDGNDLAIGTIFTMIDISARKQAERELMAGERKFRTMMESIQDPICIISQSHEVEYMNSAMTERLGRDATGETCFSAIHGLDAQCPWCARMNKSNESAYTLTVKSPLDNHTYMVSFSPFDQEAGSVSNLVVFKDITEIAATREQLQQSQKMEAIGTLAGGVAHDFNNILTVIRGHAEMGLIQATEGSQEFVDFSAIEKASERAKQLTSQLLAFSRKQRIKPQKIMLDGALSELNKMLRRLIGEDVILRTTLSGGLSPIFIDPGQLDQIIINIVVNAVDAMKSNDLKKEKVISIATSQFFVDSDFTSTHPGSTVGMHVLLEISDTGKGMDKTTMEHIFEPFYTTKELGQGTGLGLATVYGIVKQNHGYIEVESALDEYSIFKIYWPATGNTVEENGVLEEGQQAAVSCGSETILLVEDDVNVRNITRIHLQKAGYNVIEAENGADALVQVEKNQFVIDMLFTDVVMPKMNGRVLGEKIVALYPSVEILYASGYFDVSLWDNCAMPVSERFIEKPYDQRDLLVKIRQLLDTREK